jgi:hypothetical protein
VQWSILQVAIGLSFFFFVFSLVVSAVNEGIAGVFHLRARTLETGITNLVTGSLRGDDPEGMAIVSAIYEHSMVNGYGKGKQKPAYLASRSFRNALLDVTGLLEASTGHGPEVVAKVDAALEAIPSGPLRNTLTSIWRSVERDPQEFRAGVERWFDRGMDRVTGWYRRRAKLIAFVIGLLAAFAVNADTLRTTNVLWKDDAKREAIVGEVQAGKDQTTANQALQRLDDLGFPIGWARTNRPHDATDWLVAVFGWLVTAIAISLGAPFWFDVLNRFGSLRAAGNKPESVLAPTASKTLAVDADVSTH